MRARLHAERRELERLLERIERGGVRGNGLIERQLRHFSYLDTLTLRLPDEERLRERYWRAVDTLAGRGYRGGVATALVNDVMDTLAPTHRVIGGDLVERYDALAGQLRRTLPRLCAAERHTIANLVERRAHAARTELLERLRDAYGNERELAAGYGSDRRARRALTTYGSAIERAERTLDALVHSVRERDDAAPAGGFVIGTRSMADAERIATTLARDASVARLHRVPYVLVRGEPDAVADLVEHYRGTRGIRTVYRERVYGVAPVPAARDDEEAWNLELVQAPHAWERTRGRGALVAIIDTGAAYDHPDLAGRFGDERGVDYVSGGDAYDDNGHGTHVSGTVAGAKTGVAPEATIRAVKVLDADGYGSEGAVLQGIEYAIDAGVHVINMSLGSSFASEAEAELVAIAARNGIAVCCAAGNDGTDTYDYPASYDGATSVAAVDRDAKHAWFSNHNDRVALSAPGVNVRSTVPGGGYETMSGTSMATPHVAGACALLAAQGRSDPVTRLAETARQLGQHDYFGAGLIDCDASTRPEGKR